MTKLLSRGINKNENENDNKRWEGNRHGTISIGTRRQTHVPNIIDGVILRRDPHPICGSCL